MRKDELVFLGHISKPQGNKGEVRVSLELDSADELIEFCENQKTLYASKQDTDHVRALKPEEFWVHNKGYGIFKFFEIDTISDAEEIAGWNLYMDEKDRWELPEGNYYLDQIIGLKVYDLVSGSLYGEIKEVMTSTADHLYVVSDGKDEFYIPAIREFVKELNVEKGYIKVSIPEGLADINKKNQVFEE